MSVTGKVFGFDSFGGPDVFQEKHVTVALNDHNNVLLKIERIGINPVDAYIRSGKMAGGGRPQGFTVLGSEAQCEVLETAPETKEFAVGDKVILRSGSGCYATCTSTTSNQIFKIPADMPLDFAAGFSATASTAYWALHGGFLPLASGGTLAVMGASGGVGSFVVQLGKKMNLTIIAVASAKNQDYLMGLGADTFIDYNDASAVARHAQSADYVIDASLFNAGENIALSLLKDNGTYMGLTTLPKNVDRGIKPVFLARTASMSNSIAIPKLLELYETNGLSLQIAYKLPLSLEGVKEAHRLLEGKRNSGKIILSEQVH